MNITPRRYVSIAALAAFALLLTTSGCGGDSSAPASASESKSAKALPLSPSFGRGTPGEHGGPFAVTLKNTSANALQVKGQIVQSVAAHNSPKTIDLPAREIKAGDTWTINDLAVQDRVIVTAEGYDKLEVVVPDAAKQ